MLLFAFWTSGFGLPPIVGLLSGASSFGSLSFCQSLISNCFHLSPSMFARVDCFVRARLHRLESLPDCQILSMISRRNIEKRNTRYTKCLRIYRNVGKNNYYLDEFFTWDFTGTLLISPYLNKY